MSVLVAAADAAVRRPVQPELSFAVPPPGMATLRRFTLDPLDDVGLLFALRSVEQPSVRLFVVPPRPYFPHYAPTIDADTAEALGLGDDDEPVILVVVHPGQEQHPPTANLLAPVVVHPRTGAAQQVVLDDDRWPLRAPFGEGTAAA